MKYFCSSKVFRSSAFFSFLIAFSPPPPTLKRISEKWRRKYNFKWDSKSYLVFAFQGDAWTYSLPVMIWFSSCILSPFIFLLIMLCSWLHNCINNSSSYCASCFNFEGNTKKKHKENETNKRSFIEKKKEKRITGGKKYGKR